MDENEKKQLTTEEALKHLMKTTEGDIEDEINRFVDLILDLIAERSEEKAEEAVDKHERSYNHDIPY